MKYIKYVILLSIGLLLGCAVKYTPIQYPLPDPLNRPNIVFIKMQHEPNLSCMTTPHAKSMLFYIIDLETELSKARITISEINKRNK